MNANLHTDLANKEEREKITLAGRKIKTVVEVLTEDKGTTKQNVIKAGLRAINIDELRKDKEKEFNLVDDKETAPLDKLIVLRDLQAELYKREGFTGELPELLLTDEPNSFAHNGKIFISINDLNSGNASALLYAHENAHLVDYDKGEEIAKYAETKIGKNDPNEKFTESEREEYIKSLRERVKIDKTLEEQFEIARNTPINEREKYEAITAILEGAGGPGGGKVEFGVIYNKNEETGEEEFGYIIGGQASVGAILPEAGIIAKAYSDLGTPIKEFQGFYSSVKGKVAFYLADEFEFLVQKNKGQISNNFGIGTPTISFLGGIGYNKVFEAKNLSETKKQIIREIVKNNKEIENTVKTINILRVLRKSSEKITGKKINLRTDDE